MYKENAERWQVKEAFDNFFGNVQKYLHMRKDNEFNSEIQIIMDQIWKKQLKNPSQFFSC